ncbi:hypothetical protein SCA6_019328 [Theobroma cacao]
MDDSGFMYFFKTRQGELEGDQIPEDYELEVVDPDLQGRFRCCHALIDREQPDSLQVVTILEQKLFHQHSYIPSGQPVPELIQTSCRCDILNFTESLLRDECNANRSKFLIIVMFGPLAGCNDDEIELQEEIEIDTAGDRMDVEVNEHRFVPASKSAIEALENVCWLGDNECVICLGNFAKEEEAKRMPCGHVFHGGCIVRWLEKSHLCPLCRYAMPLD